LDDTQYQLRYLEISSGLREIARNYIRLYSSSQTEMAEHFGRLDELARGWTYRYDLTEGAASYRKELEAEDPRRAEIFSAWNRERLEVVTLRSTTAEYIAKLARRLTQGVGMPPPG
jgi:hypothetical protein